jgi:hydroxymethylbilane synthase
VIRLATRGSDLALWQARAVSDAIARSGAAEPVELVLVRTAGDVSQDRDIDLGALGGVNLFTAEVDRAVAEGRADAGVHSLKDLGTAVHAGLALGAVLERGPVEDVLVSRTGRLAALPRGAAVGTSSPRRRAMALRIRPDLRCVTLRGNVDTRLRKVERGDVDAAILARAGIERLGLGGAIAEVLSVDEFLPAVGQGAVAVTCRAGDARVAGLLARIRHPQSFDATRAERALLARLGAGCHAPVGALARVAGGRLALRCRILAYDGASEVSGSIEGAAADAEAIGVSLASELLGRGGAELLRVS